jgi:ABC-type nitrate/sulfonate/bicarbonate transport system substrate-binding protein
VVDRSGGRGRRLQEVPRRRSDREAGICALGTLRVKALQKTGAQILLDSSKLKGYIVDVLVAEREFLRDHPDLVRAVVEAHCRAAYAYAQITDAMAKLVIEDARRTGTENLDEAQARQIVQGIRWKNTLENYAHFGLNGAAQNDVPNLEDAIANIIEVLVKTKALEKDPLPGRQSSLFTARCWPR